MKPFFAVMLSLFFLNAWVVYFPTNENTSHLSFTTQDYCHLIGRYQLSYHFDKNQIHQADFRITGPKGSTSAVLTRSYNAEDIFLQYPITNDDHYIAEYYSPIIPLMIQKNGAITQFKLHHWVFSNLQCHSRPL